MEKVLFIDRDGTILSEPLPSEQVDSLEKLEFLPKVITSLSKIAKELDYELVMVTNQDGLGTASFPEDIFWPAQNKMLKTLEGEGIVFSDILIDKTFVHENAPTRKPGIGMLKAYMAGGYDLPGSYVIGDRLTDVQLAKNIGAKGIFIGDKATDLKGLDDYCALITHDWEEIYLFLKLPERKASVKRKTKETDIEISINLDGKGKASISTGLSFFNHMLEQVPLHARIDMYIRVKGDLEVDEHHTIEDTAIALGEAFTIAMGDKRGMERYGFCLPMDDSLAQVALDFGGRNWLVWDVDFNREKIGDVPTEMFLHFFKSFSDAAKCNLNIKAEGANEHHKIEAVFKAFAKSIKMALKRDKDNMNLPSTKGMI